MQENGELKASTDLQLIHSSDIPKDSQMLFPDSDNGKKISEFHSEGMSLALKEILLVSSKKMGQMERT